MDLAGDVFLLLGAGFALIAAIGVHRVPDVYSEGAPPTRYIRLRPTLALLEEFTYHVPRRPPVGLRLEVENESVGQHRGRHSSHVLVRRQRRTAGGRPSNLNGVIRVVKVLE